MSSAAPARPRRLRRLSLVGAMAVGLVAALAVAGSATNPRAGTNGADLAQVAATTPSGPPPAQCSKPYTGHPTRLGVNLSTVTMGFGEAVQHNLSLFHHLPVVRVYDSYVAPGRAWRGQKTSLPRGTAIVPSFQLTPQQVLSGHYDRTIRGFFRNAPKHRQVFWNYYHEPETGVDNGEYTAAQYRQAWRHIVDLSIPFCRSNLHPTLILTGWTANPSSGYDWRDYYPGRRYISVIAWDQYNGVFTRPSQYPAPRDLYHYQMQISHHAGKGFGLAETASALVAGDGGQARAAWLRRVGRWNTRHHAAFVTYFNSAPGLDFRLTDDPSRGMWASLMSR